jgi:hypothetical protein
MKKISFFAVVFLTGFFVISNLPQFTVLSAKNENQNGAQKTIDSSTAQERTIKDRELATTIRGLTSRSTAGLTERPAAGGGFTIDLEDRFQNVMLSRVEADGEPSAACVTSIEEANEFFGRNLETGEILFSNLFRKTDTETVAARHGMSGREFEFYKKLIEEAELRRAENPDLAAINIVNGDGAGEGFNDPTAVAPEGGNNGTTRGEQRLNLFNFAAGIWGAYLDTNVPININSQFNSLTPCTTSGGVLGSAGTVNIHRDFSSAQFPGTWYHAALANKRTGTDLNTNPEINARFNTDVDNGCLGAGSRFYYGLDNSTPSQRINLLVVLLHEMGHGLGFSSFASGNTGALNGGFADIYTRYMFDRTTGKYWYQMTDAERQASAINSNNVLWDGANVKISSSYLVNGRDTENGRVMLFTPATFQGGSSVSHWSTAASPNLLMEPSINPGLPINLDLTRQMMRDIGWYSDATADLIPDTITNVQPSGGTLAIGSSINITWTNTGGFDRNVTIDLSTDGGATYTTLATNIANTGSFNFTVPNNATTQGRIRVREHNFVDPMGVSSANFAISTTPAANRTRFDFDGDGKADVSVFRPSNGAWYLQQSQNGFTGISFGQAADRIVPADYDGDGKTDVAVYRSGTWYLQRSQSGFTGIAFGSPTDTPVPADFDGDGRAELAVFRPSNGAWYIYNLATSQTSGASFGTSEDKPLPADFDGDGKADIAVFRPSNGTWYLQRSSLGFTGIAFGASEDKPVPADYDGDGKSDVAVFRPSSGTWYLQRSQLGFTGIAFGAAGDQPAAADYDGDGRADVAVFRNGTWYLQRSTQGFTGIAFGVSSDRPTPGAFVF